MASRTLSSVVVAAAALAGAGCTVAAEPGAPRPPVAVGVDALPDGFLNEATATMRRLERWRGVAFVDDVAVRMVPADPQGREGWYDARRDELVLVADRPARFRALTLVHELCHALQDQHLDLGARGPAAPGDDAERAWLALVEGEATLAAAELAGLDLHAHHHGLAGGPLVENTDAQDTLFTYMEGARYVAALRDAGGWAAVEARWAAPPRTTLEVLAPGVDASVATPDQLGGGVAAGAEGMGRWLARTAAGAAARDELSLAWRGDAWRPEGWTVRLATAEAADQFEALAPAIRALSLAPRADAVHRLDARTVVLRGP